MNDHKVLLIHGIRTQAEWQTDLQALFDSVPGVETIPLRYGYFDLLRFWLPFKWLREQPIDRIEAQLDEVLRDPTHRMSIIAHSYGCYVAAKVLERSAAFRERLNYLIYCGSVLPDDYDWSRLEELNRDRIVNEASARDLLPVLAKTTTWGYGASGTFGFGDAKVRDRHHYRKHSDYMKRPFAERYWLPFIRDGAFVPSGDVGQKAPWWLSMLTVVQPKYVVPLLIAVAALAPAVCRRVPGACSRALAFAAPGARTMPQATLSPPAPIPSATPSPTAPAMEGPRPIAFVADPNHDGNDDLFTIEPGSGHRPHQLTNTSALTKPFKVHLDGAEWSPRGDRIAFLSNETGYVEAFSMAADAKDKVQLSSIGPGHKQIEWRRDASALLMEWTDPKVISSTQQSLRQVYRLAPAMAGVTPITSSPENLWNPSWSPDGGWIVFVWQKDAADGVPRNAQIYVMNERGELRRLIAGDITPTSSWNQAPSWSPDGSQIAFSSNYNSLNHLDVVPVTRQVDALTFGPRHTIATGNADDQAARWSPDGSRVAIVLDGSPAGLSADDRRRYYDIAILNADGSGLVQVTDNNVYDGHVTWSPRGDAIAFESGAWVPGDGPSAVDERQIWRSDLDGNAVPLTTAGGHGPSWGW